MKALALSTISIMACALVSCSHPTTTAPAPSNTVVVSFASKISGKWLLYVDAERLTSSVRPAGRSCSAHSYPLDLRNSFRGSVSGTFANLFDNIEIVDAPPTVELARQRGARGIITVRGDESVAQFVVIDQFFTASVSGAVRLSAAVTVDTSAGRVFGQTVDGDGRGEGDVGTLCDGVPRAMSSASENALRLTMRRLGEAIGNSERVRRAQ